MISDHYCSCEDWPCCGHGSGLAGGGLDPEDAEEWLEGLDPEDREFAETYMAPCPECGEMRPKDDSSLREFGMCHMCTQDSERRNSPVAANNLRYFGDRLQSLAAENEALREENQRLKRQFGVGQ